MDANAITWLRTAAVSALATDYLAAPKAKSIALIGAGQQASSHLAALQSVRAIEKVFIYDRTAERARKLIAKQQHNSPNVPLLVVLLSKKPSRKRKLSVH